jgi:hypothetical protein
MRAFLPSDGKTGFAVAPDGEIVNVFRLPGAPKGARVAAVLSAIEQGGTYTNTSAASLRSSVAGSGSGGSQPREVGRSVRPQGMGL